MGSYFQSFTADSFISGQRNETLRMTMRVLKVSSKTVEEGHITILFPMDSTFLFTQNTFFYSLVSQDREVLVYSYKIT